MKKSFLIITLICIFTNIYLVSSEENPLYLNFQKEIYTYKNMAVIPIIASKDFIQGNGELKKFVSLKSALENDYIIISERSIELQGPGFPNVEPLEQPEPSHEQEAITDTVSNVLTGAEIDALLIQVQGGRSDVNNLLISNKSDKYIYLMAGDLVKGGKQDRVIAKDIIVPPNTEKMNLPVFCVEQNRWRYKGENQNFGKYSNVVSNTVRSAVQVEQEQSAVWSKVSAVQSSYGIESETGAYSDVETSEEYNNQRDDYIKYFSDKATNNKEMVGMIVVAGDSIIGCDIFANHELLTMQYNSLLYAYITDVISINVVKTSQNDKYIDKDKITKFFNQARTEFLAPQKQDVKQEIRFFYNERVVHYTKFE
ncbi:MAG: DUF6569 family protein [bacterium]